VNDYGVRSDVRATGQETCAYGRTEMSNQRLNYIHWNPVTADFVAEPWHWLYSSAADYFTEKKGLLDVIILDGF
jgi:hypothetical protein